MSIKNDRINQILSMLKKSGNLSVKEIAATFKVSEMTIRRDLNTLKESHLINRTYGQATLNNQSAAEDNSINYDLSEEKIKQDEEKDKIGRFASSLIIPGDVLIIDSGSTTSKLAKYIPEDVDITVLCYNFEILVELKKKRGVNLILAGGYYHRNDEMFESPQGISLIENIRATKLFISAYGVHEKLGLTCAYSYEVTTKRTVIKSSLMKILLTDSSKFGKVRTAFFAQLEEIDVIVTDSGISQEWKDIIEQTQIKLYIV
jgi:DeoR family deoxyribose operon repressor